MEVAPGLHRVEAPLGERIVCLYLLLGDDHVLLVDTGLDATPREHLVPYLESLGVETRRNRYVLNTHADFDHTGGNASLRELAPHAIFMSHELDRPMIESIDRMIAERYGEFAADHGIDESEDAKAWIRANARDVRVDVALAGGERIHLGAGWYVDILHTPGHSRGHVSVHDPRSRSIVIADAALWNTIATKEGAPAFPPTYRYVDTYLASIQRLQGMPVDNLLTSHYPVHTGPQAAEFLAVSRSFVDAVEAALREELRVADKPVTMRDLIGVLGPRLGHWPQEADVFLVYPLQGHLERLLAYGLVAVNGRNGQVGWRWTGRSPDLASAIP